MKFAIILVCTTALCFALRNPIKKFPMLFYVMAVLVDALFVAGSFVSLPREIWDVLMLLIQKCTLALAMFVVVMCIGVFSDESRVKKWLKPIRAELSIIAWLLSLGHMATYLASYAPRLFAGYGLDTNVLISFLIAIVLLVLLLLLGVTSFNFVKKRMKTETWKRVQWLAYPFFILVYIHLLFMLLPSALLGGVTAQISIAVYSVVFIGYVVLRILRYVKDRGESPEGDAAGRTSGLRENGILEEREAEGVC